MCLYGRAQVSIPSTFASLVVTTVMAASCAVYAQSGPPGGTPPPPEVTYVDVKPTTVPITYELVGLVQPSRKIEVRSRVKGFLHERLFSEGTSVTEGQILYRIDRRTFEADVKVAEAQVAQARSREQLASREEKRLASLVANNTVSQSDYDRASEELAAARAAERLAVAQLDKARLELSFTDIKAPITGYTTKTKYEPGAYIDDAENSLLTTVERLDPIHVVCGVSEREYLLFQQDLATGRLILPAGEKMRLRVVPADGHVYEHEGALDYEESGFSIESGISQMRGLFPNPARVLRPGQFVKVRVVGYLKPSAIVVPQRSIMQGPLGAAVFVIGDGNKLEPRPVKTGRMAGDDWIVEEGLRPGDRVMVEGLMKTQGPGTVVAPVPHGTTLAKPGSAAK